MADRLLTVSYSVPFLIAQADVGANPGTLAEDFEEAFQRFVDRIVDGDELRFRFRRDFNGADDTLDLAFADDHADTDPVMILEAGRLAAQETLVVEELRAQARSQGMESMRVHNMSELQELLPSGASIPPEVVQLMEIAQRAAEGDPEAVEEMSSRLEGSGEDRDFDTGQGWRITFRMENPDDEL